MLASLMSGVVTCCINARMFYSDGRINLDGILSVLFYSVLTVFAWCLRHDSDNALFNLLLSVMAY